MVFGGLIGAGLGGAGGLLHNRRVKGLEGEGRMLANVLAENGFEAGEAGRLASSAVNVLADMRERRELSRIVRGGLAGKNQDQARIFLDGFTRALRDGRDADFKRIRSDTARALEDEELRELDEVLKPIGDTLAELHGKEAADVGIALLRARARVASKQWSASGQEITPAQWIRDKVGLKVEVGEKGNEAPQALMHAMQRSKAPTLSEFTQDARAGKISFYVSEQIPSSVRHKLGIGDLITNIPYYYIQHLDNHHATEADHLLSMTDDVLANADYLFKTGKLKTGGELYTAVKENGNTAQAVVFHLSRSKKKGNRILPFTSFQADPNSIRNVVEQKFRAATSPDAGGASSLPKPLNEDEIRVLAALNDILGPERGKVKEKRLHQFERLVPRGSITFNDGATVIRLFKDSADISTFAHETGHLFVRDMEELIKTGRAPKQLARDMLSLRAFTAEFDDPAALKAFYEQSYAPAREAFRDKAFERLSEAERTDIRYAAGQEKLANAFVTYLAEGRAPSEELESVFERFRDWLVELYRSFSAQGAEINPELRAVFDRMLADAESSGPGGAMRRSLESNLIRAGHSPAEAGRLASSAVNMLADLPERRELSLAVRKSLAGMDRAAAGKLLDRVMLALRDGEAVDVGHWARELGAENTFTRAWRIAQESIALGEAYDRVRDHPLAGTPDEVLATIEPEDIEAVLVHRGPAVMKDGVIKVQGNALKKAGFSKRGLGLVKIIFGHGEGGNKTPGMPPVTKEDVMSLPRLLREYLPAEKEGDVTVWRIPREDGNHLLIVTGKGQDGPASRLVSMYVDLPERASSQKKKAYSESLSLPGERGKDTGQGISGFTSGGQNGPLLKKIGSAPGSVNAFSPSKPDFTPLPSEPLLTPPSLEDFARLEREAAASEGGSPLDLEATRLAEEGRALPQDLEAVAAARAELERVNRLEETGLSILECVLNTLSGGRK